jgi:Trk-type K+ transport system membrane component
MKDNKAVIFLSIIILSICLLIPSAYSLKVKTHDAINEHIAQNNTVGFSLDDYLKGNLGFI